MDEIDLKLLAAVQEGFPISPRPISPRPFRDLGRALGLEEDEVISRLAMLQKEGLVRRIGPILDLRRMGKSGILAALAVPLDRADGVAEVVSLYPEVSHNYLRPNDSGYNLWFTVSGTEERIQDILQEIRAKTGLKMLVLPTLKIFKIGVKFDIV
ncbi:MAG: AsnC family transcriptional regulator [Methanothrix sp.]|nr:AsnC family transcriptional regulator [Methanothrix sp.]